MKRHSLALWGAAVAAACLAGESIAHAQQDGVFKRFRPDTEEPPPAEIRRAEPVRRSTPSMAATPAPSSSETVRRAQPVRRTDPTLRPPAPVEEETVRRAEPIVRRPAPSTPAIDEGTPVATPMPKRNGRREKATPTPKAVAAATPVPTPTPIPMPEPADPGTIRISPQGPQRTADQAQLAVADAYWNRGMFAEAGPEYQRYVDLYPTAPDVPAATFRLAECYRKTGALNQARDTYDALLTKYQVGDFVGPSAYFMADLYYQNKQYAAALPYYRKAYSRLKEPAVINAAKFFAARCLEAMGGSANRFEASELYRDLADSSTNNPFADASRLSLALLLKDASRNTEALKQIQLVAKQTTNADIKAEATVRSGLWLLEAEQAEKAIEELKKALALPNVAQWKEAALLGLYRAYYDTGKYQQVVDGFRKEGEGFAEERRGEMILLAANSYRQLNKAEEALPLYNRLAKEYSASPYAKEAAYQRLVLLYNAGDPALVSEIDVFLTNAPDERKREQVQLMKAESLYKKEDFAAAAPVYQLAADSTYLPAALRAEALFKLGWCHMQVKAFEPAIKAYTAFIDGNPTHASVCSARVQRGIAYESTKNLPAAEKDYLEVIRRFPKCGEREFALQREALIRSQVNDNVGMVQHFEMLLRDYPKSAASAQANYWIGRASYEKKDYQKAVGALTKARELDKAEYFERATLPLIYCYYYLEDMGALQREIALYRKDGKSKVPVEVLRWMADKYFDGGTWEDAEKSYQYVTERKEEVKPRDWLKLGQAQMKLGKFTAAADSLGQYLTSVKEPVSRALGLLELGKAQVGMKDYAAAQKSVDEVLTLQPEGKLSGEARILAGDVEAAKGDWEAAAKLYLSVSLILDDEDVTPRALERAVTAYQKAGKEAEAKKTQNTLGSRYPEYLRKPKKN